MKKITYTFLIAFAFLSFTLISKKNTKKTDIKTIQLGDKLPKADHKMTGLDEDLHTLHEMMDKKGLLVIFSACDCPFVIGSNEDNEGWETRYANLHKVAQKNEIGMVLINSNEAKRQGADSFANMKKRAEDNDYTMPYLVDKGHIVADAFGAKFTPHVFLFNQKEELVYVGAIDDNVKDSKSVEDKYLENALNSLGKGIKFKPAETRAMGCSIKRVRK